MGALVWTTLGSQCSLIKSQLLVKKADNFYRSLIKYFWTSIRLLDMKINKVLLIPIRVDLWSVGGASKHPAELRDQAFSMNQASSTKGSVPWKIRTSGSPEGLIRSWVLLAMVLTVLFTTARTLMIIQTPIYQQKNRKCKLKPHTARSRKARDWSNYVEPLMLPENSRTSWSKPSVSSSVRGFLLPYSTSSRLMFWGRTRISLLSASVNSIQFMTGYSVTLPVQHLVSIRQWLSLFLTTKWKLYRPLSW